MNHQSSMTQSTVSIASSRVLICALIGACTLGAAGLGGCDNAGQGAMTGAGVGALSGLAIGSFTGSAGRGAAAGAIVGGVGGAAIGDQNRRANDRANAPTAAAPVMMVIPPTPPAGQPQPQQVLSSSDRDRLALAKFARPWRVSGWETYNGQRRLVSGTATGQVDNTFFVRLDMAMTDDMSGRVNTGNVIFASEPGRGLTMNSRFDSSPSPTTFSGTVSADGMFFTLDELAPGFGPNAARMTIRFLSPDQWVADVTDRSGSTPMQTASMTFTAIR